MTVEQYHDIKHFVLVFYFYLCCETAAISCAFHEFGIFIAGDGGGVRSVIWSLCFYRTITEYVNLLIIFWIFFSCCFVLYIFSNAGISWHLKGFHRDSNWFWDARMNCYAELEVLLVLFQCMRVSFLIFLIICYINRITGVWIDLRVVLCWLIVWLKRTFVILWGR